MIDKFPFPGYLSKTTHQFYNMKSSLSVTSIPLLEKLGLWPQGYVWKIFTLLKVAIISRENGIHKPFANRDVWPLMNTERVTRL